MPQTEYEKGRGIVRSSSFLVSGFLQGEQGVNFFSVKMRASRERDGVREHISGAEHMVAASAVPELARDLVLRAQNHSKGVPDFINIKVEEVEEASCLRLKALPVRSLACETAKEGLELARDLLKKAGVADPDAVVRLMPKAGQLRGAMVLDADTLERLEPDRERGVRATNMGRAENTQKENTKNHYAEALVLATKVANAPHIVAEICISDDPDYVTGYVASKSLGYVRILRMKEMGSPEGGRIFLYRGPREELSATLEFIEHKPVLVEDLPEKPGDSEKGAKSGDQQPQRPDKWAFLARGLSEIREKGLARSVRDMQSGPGPWVEFEGRKVLLMASNDYLGLANHPKVKENAARALLQWGTGSGGSRLTTGSMTLHGELEARLAAFKKTEAALLFNTGYMANVGVITALCGRGDVIFSDELNHASIIDGCRQSRAEVVVYRHNDMADLEEKAKRHVGRRGLIVSDSVFSMDGDVVPLADLCRIADAYGFLSMIDEAHATGVVGETGHGVTELCGCRPDIVVGTLSKALGSEGGFVCASAQLVEYLVNRARSFIFSTALPAACVAAALTSLDILEREPKLVQGLRSNVAFFCSTLRGLGIAATSESAIVPLIVGDERRATRAAELLLEQGIFLSAIRYPSVARGSARLRATVRADHNREDLARAANGIARVLKETAGE